MNASRLTGLVSSGFFSSLGKKGTLLTDAVGGFFSGRGPQISLYFLRKSSSSEFPEDSGPGERPSTFLSASRGFLFRGSQFASYFLRDSSSDIPEASTPE